MNINYKSDFDFLLRMKDAQGEDIGFPDYNWHLRIYTKNGSGWNYTASCINGRETNCREEDGAIRIICDNHGLKPGILMGEFYADVPNAIYPDGRRLTVTPFPLGIRLVPTAGDDAGVAEIQTSLPIIYINAYELAVELGYEGTSEEYMSALTELPSLIAELKSLRDELSGTSPSQTDGVMINLNGEDRDTAYTLESAIAAIGKPRYGSILMFVDESDQFEMWHFTGRDYTNMDDWEPVGVRLSASYVFINENGAPVDVSVGAGTSTQWAAG